MASLLIIGGGIIGLCTAYYAVQQGHTVTLLERGGPAHDGCSSGNAGMIVPSHFVPLAAPGMISLGLRMLPNPESPFAIRPTLNPDLLDWCWKFARACNPRHVERSAPVLRDLNLASRKCYEELAACLDQDFGLTRRGLLMLCKSEKTLQDEAHLAEQACRLGLAAEVLSPQQAAKLDPDIRMDIAGAVYFRQDCHLTPSKLLAGLTRSLENRIRFAWNTSVTGFRTDGAKITAVETDRDEFEADEIVIAGGAWSPELARKLGLKLPVQGGKGYSLTLEQPRQLPGLCSILTEARVAVTPMGTTLRFAGTMEIGANSQSVNQARVNGIIKSISNYFPEFRPDDFRATPVWSGLRPCSPDGLPYIGRFARYTNLSTATGHAMMGLSLGPITGKLMAQFLAGETPDIALDCLSPDRYA